MTKREPCELAGEFYPKVPQSVKKILPVMSLRTSECGPSNGAPSYSLTSSASVPSAADREITDCFSRSAR